MLLPPLPLLLPPLPLLLPPPPPPQQQQLPRLLLSSASAFPLEPLGAPALAAVQAPASTAADPSTLLLLLLLLPPAHSLRHLLPPHHGRPACRCHAAEIPVHQHYRLSSPSHLNAYPVAKPWILEASLHARSAAEGLPPANYLSASSCSLPGGT